MPTYEYRCEHCGHSFEIRRSMNDEHKVDCPLSIRQNFENCIIILQKGETEIPGCTFKNCKLMLKGNAYTVGRIIKLFTRESPLKVLDIEEPFFEKEEGMEYWYDKANGGLEIISGVPYSNLGCKN